MPYGFIASICGAEKWFISVKDADEGKTSKNGAETREKNRSPLRQFRVPCVDNNRQGIALKAWCGDEVRGRVWTKRYHGSIEFRENERDNKHQTGDERP